MELEALKPGNVHIHASGHGMSVAQLERSAEVAAQWLADPSLGVGMRVLRAVEATLAAVKCNTNLGILLLAAPLGKAAAADGPTDLQRRVAEILAALDVDDAVAAFQAIRLAKPAGLGQVANEDVAFAPSVDLRQAMALAAGRDRIARAYVTNYADIFDFGLNKLSEARRQSARPEEAITTLHMAFLAEFVDSHIARKHGARAAQYVREKARELAPLWRPVATLESFAGLLAFDAELKAQGLNPGTTADFVVNTVFAEALRAELNCSGTRIPSCRNAYHVVN
jgi:triphosphoribosyl-dephospho-CoA synthase